MVGARRTWKQRLLLATSTLGVLAALAAAGSLAFVQRSFREITRISEVDQALATTALPEGSVIDSSGDPGTAKNFLLVGTDSAAGLDPDDPVTIGRDNDALLTDTMLVLRIDPERDEAGLLSIPRDLYVPIAGRNRNGRINTALAFGGPEGRSRLIETIEDYFEFDINHYVEVDFKGFRDLVDELGGVPIYFKYPARDEATGLQIPDAGCYLLDSTDALAYARTRSFQAYIDGKWRTDQSGDIGRNSRQQHFIRQSLRRSVSLTGRNLLRIGELIQAGVGSVSLDSGVTARDLLSLANHFRNYDPEELPSYVLPVNFRRIRGAEVLELQEDAAQPILDVFRGVRDGEVSPRSTRVRVDNGTGAPSEATNYKEALSEVGFEVTGAGDAPPFDNETAIIEYRAGDYNEAVLLAEWLEGEVDLVEVEVVSGADVRLITGTDLDRVRSAAEERTDLTTTTTTSTTTTSTSTTTTTRDGPTTTTVPLAEREAEASARIGVVTDPPDGESCG